MKQRLVYLFEAAAIVALVGLGSVWPSAFTFLALGTLPAFLIALACVAHPTLLAPRDHGDPRRVLRLYVHVSALLALVAVTSFAVEMELNHSVPADILVGEGAPARVGIVFGVENGDEPSMREGRRVFRIPASGLLVTRAPRDDGWWRDDERRFFIIKAGGPEQVTGRMGRSSATSVGACTAPFEEYVLDVGSPGRSPISSLVDAGALGLLCRQGRVLRR